MKKYSAWLGRCLSPVLIVLMVSACSQSEITQKSLTAVLNQSKHSTAIETEGKQASGQSGGDNSAKTIAQVAPQAKIATFQTQQRTSGFSADSQHFMHLESWRDTGAGIPHAAMQVVNLATNTCVANGCMKTQFNESQASQSLAIAESNLLQQTQSLRQNLQLTSPSPGNSLPEMARSQQQDGTETVTVQTTNNQPLRLTLKQKQTVTPMPGGAGEKEQAAMQLEVNYGGKTRSLGSLDKMQDWKVKFSIREVRQSSDGKTIAVLLTAAERAFEGTLGRTMVQGFEL